MKRIRDSDALRRARLAGVECVLCGDTLRLSIHHVYPRSQMGDDVRANLVTLCGSGTTGHHGDVEQHLGDARRALGLHILAERPDTIDYLSGKLGSQDRALAWLERNLLS